MMNSTPPIPEIARSAELLTEIHGETGMPMQSIDWDELIRSELESKNIYDSVQSLNANAFSRAVKKTLQSKKIGSLADANYVNVKMILGAIVRGISLRMATKLEAPHHQLLQIRGAINAFRAVPSQGAVGELSGNDSVVALAIWAVGMFKAHDDTLRPHSEDSLTRVGKRGLSDEYRWVSGLQEFRSRDLKYLVQQEEGAAKAVADLIKWNHVIPAEIDAVFESHSTLLENAGPSFAERRILEIWPTDLNIFWHDINEMTMACRRLLKKVERISGPRGDVLIVGDLALVSEQQGFMDSLLTVCTNIAGDFRNQSWHEREVSKAIRQSWKMFGRIFENVEWVRSLGVPDLNNVLVQSEIDVVVRSKELLLTIQAKSARSDKSKQRERTTVAEAMKQHRIFRESSESGAWALEWKQSTKNYRIHPRIRKFNIPECIQIPITVGAEAVHLWSVGSSALDEEFARVLTTLDHMRVVNFYVPKWFRPIYWMDRYSQEYSALKFVDEVDYLGKWVNYLNVGGYDETFEVVEDLVMSTSSQVETSLALRNTLSSVDNSGNDFISRTLLENLGEFEFRKFSIVFPELNRLFEQLVHTSAEDCLLLARMILGNRLGGVEEMLKMKESSVLRGGIGTIVVRFDSIGPSEVLEIVPDCFLHLQLVAGRWKLSRIANAASIASSWRIPRFSLPHEAGAPAEYNPKIS